MTSVLAEPINVAADYPLARPACELNCGREAQYLAKGCMDREPVHMCNECLQRGLDLVRKTINLYHRLNKKIMVCGDCYRPLLTLETHLEIQEL